MSKEAENTDAPDSEVAFEPSLVAGEGTARGAEEVPVVEDAPPTPGIEHIDIGIVGGGLSGVYAAHKLRSLHPDKRIFVFEGTGVVGGKQSIPFSNSSGTGFFVNLPNKSLTSATFRLTDDKDRTLPLVGTDQASLGNVSVNMVLRFDVLEHRVPKQVVGEGRMKSTLATRRDI